MMALWGCRVTVLLLLLMCSRAHITAARNTNPSSSSYYFSGSEEQSSPRSPRVPGPCPELRSRSPQTRHRQHTEVSATHSSGCGTDAARGTAAQAGLDLGRRLRWAGLDLRRRRGEAAAASCERRARQDAVWIVPYPQDVFCSINTILRTEDVSRTPCLHANPCLTPTCPCY